MHEGAGARGALGMLVLPSESKRGFRCNIVDNDRHSDVAYATSTLRRASRYKGADDCIP